MDRCAAGSQSGRELDARRLLPRLRHRHAGDRVHRIIGYELCHPIPHVNGEPVGLDFADLNARLAAEYMRGVVNEAARTATVAKAV